MSLKPYTTPGQNRYCRLLPAAGPPIKPGGAESLRVVESLLDLARNMNDASSVLSPARRRTAISAGYTYFGQFIDHDLTNDRSSVEDAWLLEPEDIANGQSPRLDLSHIYGRGPWDPVDERLYQGVRLKIGSSFDVAVDSTGPLVADSRAIENLILRQLTAVFCRLHNHAVDQFAPLYKDCRALYRRARLHTSWQFQLLVFEDFLPRVIVQSVYEEVFRRRRPSIEWSVVAIPVEFSVAAMRFGHSMVRDRYPVGRRDFSLPELMELGRKQMPLALDEQIDWGRLVSGASQSGPAITAQPIDSGIADGLHRIPMATILLFNPAQLDSFVPIQSRSPASARSGTAASYMPVPLPFLSLLRGAGLRLPTGQTMAAAFGQRALSAEELTRDFDGNLTSQGRALRRNGFVEATPLFFYLLKESEVRSHGNCLGPLGSTIVAETIYAALLHDPESILNHQELEWCEASDPDRPAGMCRPLWDLPIGRKPIRSLRDLLAYSRFFPS